VKLQCVKLSPHKCQMLADRYKVKNSEFVSCISELKILSL
jgi:hypothetical protein